MIDKKRLARYGEGAAHIGFVLFAFGLSFSIALAQTALALMAAGFLLASTLGSKLRWRKTPVDVGLYVFLAFSALSIWVGKEYGIHHHDIAKALGLPLIFPLVFCVVQARPLWGAQALKAFLLGVGLHSYYALGLWIFDALEKKSLYVHAHGSFGLNLTFAEITAMGLIFFLASMWTSRDKRWGRWFIPASGLAVILSLARGTYLGLVAGLVVVVWLRLPRYRVAVAGLILGLVGAWAALPHVIDMENLSAPTRKMLNPFGMSVKSNRYRMDMLIYGSRMIRENPLGVGPGNVLRAFPKYIPAELEDWKKNPNYGHLHNNLAQVAGERGIPALVAWLLMLVMGALHLINKIRDGSRVAGGALAAGVVFLVCGLTEYTLGDSEVAMVFWFLSGLGLAPKKENQESLTA